MSAYMFREIGLYTPSLNAIYVSKIFRQECSNNPLWKYEFGDKSKSRKKLKTPFLHNVFSINLVHKTEFLNMFWFRFSSNFDTVLLLLRTILGS